MTANASPELSLVVPVFNVAAFLPRCLEGLAAQDRAQTEVLLIDDGSSDECPAILAEWASRTPFMKVIRQANGGLSAARNTGLAHARGTFVAFVDSDDFFERDYYVRLVGLARRRGLDMAIGNAMYHFEGRRPDYAIFDDGLPALEMSGSEFLRLRLRGGHFLHMVWMHVYRRDFIERCALRFVPPYIHEDVPWTTRALLAARSIAYDPHPGYFYRQRVRRFTPAQSDRRLELIIDSSIYNARELARIADDLGRAQPADAELARLLRWQLVDGGMSLFHKIEQLSARALRAAHYRRLRQERVLELLWKNAVGLRQRRKLLTRFFKARLAERG
jgi:glycosyltransferase involved in cell wall biosynthesis